MDKPRVLIYNSSFFERSETFIHQQVAAIEKTDDVFLAGYARKNEPYFPLQAAHYIHIDNQEPWWSRLLLKIKWKLGYRFEMGHRESQFLTRVIKEQDIRLIHAHFGYNGLRILPIAKKSGIPLIVSFHGYDASDKIKYQKNYRRDLPALMEYASRLLIVSDHMPGRLGMTDAQQKKAVFVPYLIDTHFFSAAAPPTHSVDGLIHILHSGRLVPKKGVAAVVKVFIRLSKNYPEVRLHLVGEGGERPTLEELIHAAGIEEKVIFYGSQPHAEVKKRLDVATIFVMNSRIAPDGDMEGLPVTLLEAMSMGKAVVATHHAGIPMAVQHEYNGLMVEENNDVQLELALARLITDADLRGRLGSNARDTIEKKFNQQAEKSRWEAIYHSVLQASV